MLFINVDLIVPLLIIAVIVLLAYTFIRIIKWLFRAIRYLFTGKRQYKNQVNSKDWLTRAQARQEIRIQNALPPLRSEVRPQRQTLRQKRNLKHGRSATGWTFNEETQLWEPPDYLKYESKDRWEWDPKKEIWIDRYKKKRM